MDILKKDSCSVAAIFIAMVVILHNTSFTALPDNTSAAKVLTGSYELAETLSLESVEKIVSYLKQALESCDDSELIFRIRYRIGILYFKAGSLDKAALQFEQTSKDVNCPELIRLCSLNMTGQISRMTGKDKEALRAFDDLLKVAEKRLQNKTQDANILTLLKLSTTAAFGQAEIYQYQRNYDASIKEYKRLLDILGKNKSAGLEKYIPLARDRISQLYLICGVLESYFHTAQKLIEECPRYYRVPIVKLEIEAVKFLNGSIPQIEFPNGSFDAPVELIIYVKTKKENPQIPEIISTLEELCKQYNGTYAALLLNYHHAWLLDAAGQKHDSAKVLAKINESPIKDIDDNIGIQTAVNTIATYAKLQRAIILGEAGNYKPALETAYSVKPDPNNIHLLNLTESIKKSLKTLKREVPNDAKSQ